MKNKKTYFAFLILFLLNNQLFSETFHWNFTGKYLREANLQDKVLNNQDFEKANLIKVNLDYSSLNKTNFTKAGLICASLLYTNLIKAVFTRAILILADFSCSDMSKACLKNSDLRCAIFNNTNLTGADFYEANLCGTHFEYADLTNAKNLYSAQWWGASITHVKGLTSKQIIKLKKRGAMCFGNYNLPEDDTFINRYVKALIAANTCSISQELS